MKGLRIFLLSCLLLLVPLSGLAAPPEFRRLQVYVHPVVQMSRFLGSLQDNTGWGLGIGLSQGFLYKWFGFNLTLDTDYFLSDAPPPPFNSGLQLAGVRLAARARYPVRQLVLFTESHYRHTSLSSNALVNEIGSALSHDTFGLALGARYVGISPLYLECSADWDYFPGLKNTSLIRIGLAFGVRSLL